MTSTIKVNNIQNQCGANIINESSNTITIGASGDTIALASGASQSGFGREGSVDWLLLLHQEKVIFVILQVEHLQLIYQVHLQLVIS